MQLSQGYRIGSIIDARPPEFNADGFCHACAAHGWTYDRQPVLSIHPYDLGHMGPVAFNTIGRIVSQARAAAAAPRKNLNVLHCFAESGRIENNVPKKIQSKRLSAASALETL